MENAWVTELLRFERSQFQEDAGTSWQQYQQYGSNPAVPDVVSSSAARLTAIQSLDQEFANRQLRCDMLQPRGKRTAWFAETAQAE